MRQVRESRREGTGDSWKRNAEQSQEAGLERDKLRHQAVGEEQKRDKKYEPEQMTNKLVFQKLVEAQKGQAKD